MNNFELIKEIKKEQISQKPFDETAVYMGYISRCQNCIIKDSCSTIDNPGEHKVNCIESWMTWLSSYPKDKEEQNANYDRYDSIADIIF